MSIPTQVFSGLPAGEHFIRHIDHPHRVGAGSAKVHLILSPLPSTSKSVAEILREPGVSCAVPVNVGLLPFFAPGDVIRNKRLVPADDVGRRVLSIFDRGGDASLASLVIDLDRPNSSEVALWDERGARPEGYPAALYYPEITAKDYGLPLTRASRFLRVSSGGRLFYIPASELLRAFLTTHSVIATELFRQPLAVALDSMVRLSTEPAQDVSRLRVDLQRPLPHRHLGVLVNLLPALDPVASAAAARLFFSLMPESLPEDVRRRGVGARGAVHTLLPVVMPYSFGRIAINVKGAWLDGRRFVVGRMLGGLRPVLRRLEAHLVEEVSDEEAGRGGGVGVKPTDGGERDLAVDDDPGMDGASEEGDLEWNAWGDEGDDVVVIRHREVVEGRRGGRVRPGRPVGRATGQTQGGGDRGQFHGDNILPGADGRFDELWKCLHRLCARPTHPRIAEFELVIPDAGRSVRRGTNRLDCWMCLPNPRRRRRRRRGFHILRSTGMPRSVLVVRIELDNGRGLHWFEIEVDGEEGFRSLALAFRTGSPNSGVSEIIAELVAQRGKVGDAAAFASANACAAGGTLRHMSIERGAPSEFDDASVLRLIGEIAR